MAEANSDPPPAKAKGEGIHWGWKLGALVVVVGVGIAVYLYGGTRTPVNLTSALRDKLGKESKALTPPESVSVLGHVVRDGAIDMSSACYLPSDEKPGESWKNLTLSYKDKRSFKQEFAKLPASIQAKAEVDEDGWMTVELAGLRPSRASGVFNVLSDCKAGVHDVVIWELRVGSLKVGTSLTQKFNLSASAALSGSTVAPAGSTVAPVGSTVAPAGSTVAPAGSTVAPAGSTHAEGESTVGGQGSGNNLIIAYRTERYETKLVEKSHTWSDTIERQTKVPLPQLNDGTDHGLSLTTREAIDHFAERPWKLALKAGRYQVSGADCVVALVDKAHHFDMGRNDSCVLHIGGSTRMLIRTEAPQKGEVSEIKTTVKIAQTKTSSS